MPCECDDKDTRNYARYYDTPDGCDIPTKAMVAARYGTVAGLVFSTFDVVMYSHAVGMSNILSRYMFHTAPMALMGATFALVANGVQHLRKRDDIWNYFAGGAACAPILASYLGSKHALLPGALFLGVIGIIKKESIEGGYSLNPEIHPHMNTIRGWRSDYTLAADPRDAQIHTCGTLPK